MPLLASFVLQPARKILGLSVFLRMIGHHKKLASLGCPATTPKRRDESAIVQQFLKKR
jgi:hypothetical protein